MESGVAALHAHAGCEASARRRATEIACACEQLRGRLRAAGPLAPTRREAALPMRERGAAMSEASTLGESPYTRTLRPGTRTPAHPTRDDIRLLSPDFYADPHEHFAWMRANAPIYWDDATGIWGIALYADVMTVARDWETFCSGEGSRPDSSVPSMINMDPPQHVLRRRIISAGFTQRRVQDHEPYLRRKVRALLDAASARGACDFVREVATPLPMYMIGELMGLPEADHGKLLRWSDLFATGNAEQANEVRDAVIDYAAYIQRVIAERRGGAREDLVSLAVNAVVDGERLDENDLIFETMLVLVGGDETTRHVISGGLAALLEHPDQMRALRARPELVPSAVEEMLRWVTPIQNMNRTATRDTELGGQRIREGDRMLLLYPSANRDESVFARPFDFDVERTPNDHVAFGGFGRHHCLGAQLARLELRVLFEELLARWPHVELAEPTRPLRRRRGTFVLGIEEMPVRFTPA
jgi:cytochrome P450 family 142 subfamily A polypeptide 1